MRTRILAISLTLLAASARASFELLLVADNGSNTFATRAIHRFDPVSGAYLGKFGGFNGNISSTYLDQSTNSLYVIASNGTTKWNYNTGEFLGSFNYLSGTVLSAVRPSGNQALLFDGAADIPSLTFPTGNLLAYTGYIASANYQTGMWTSQNTVVCYDGNLKRMINLTVNASGTITTLGGISSALGIPEGYGQMCSNAGTNQIVMAGGSSGAAYIYAPGDSNLTATIFGGGNIMSAAKAHFGFFLGTNQGATARIDYFDQRYNLTRQFGQGVLLNPISMETVLAPEPGSMAVLGLGFVALLKRRRA